MKCSTPYCKNKQSLISNASEINAFFVRHDSIYKSMGLDCYDIDRDALNVTNENAGIYHPPCRGWGRLRGLAKPLPGEKELAIWSVDRIRKFGGILEHPRDSILWKVKKLPYPGSVDEFGGFSICLDQFWFGHKCKKNTLIYIVGCSYWDVPPIPLRFDCITHVVASSKASYKTGKKEISKKGREATPEAFAIWLYNLATIIQNKKNLVYES